MKTYNVIKLRFLTPLHVGTGKENYDFSSSELHSDTLSAALAAVKAQMSGGEIKEFLSSFRLTSAFPFVGSCYYLPRPMGLRLTENKNTSLRKRLKAIRYIERELWADYIQNKSVLINESFIHGIFLNKEVTVRQPYVNQVMQRVAVPRDNTDAEPFFFDWRFFNDDAGLYCLTDADGALFDEIVQLFIRLGEMGLGTDRNVGGGKFEVETSTIQLPLLSDANATFCLSLYLPTEDEFNRLPLEMSRYNLLLRGGYMAGSEQETMRHLWKKNIYMFDVGSVFPIQMELEGKVVDLSPDWGETIHPVYRSGKPFCLPIKI